MKLEKTLIEMVGHFTPSRASEWLRFLFSSFETDVEPIAVDTTKNENAYFAEALRLGWVARLPETDSAAAVNKPLVVVAVKMKGDLTERTSRLVQFAFAKKSIQHAIASSGRGIHGLPTQGLFFFYDADGYFRISLVSGEAEGRKLKYNSAKRQSFYVDPTAANNILRRRLGDPITTFTELKNAFSVEQLTKEFYGRLFEWYTWALAPNTGVTFPNDLANENDDRKYNHEAIIRLITRLMFTWFIRQKIPALKELFERDGLDETLKGNRGKGKFNPDSMEDDNYYRCILQNLFFATFNCPQTGKGRLLRRWINVDLDERGDGRGLSDDFNVTTVYRYRNEFKNPDAFLERMRGVPFLNCALFDCLDKAERKQDGGRKLYFDGFSTKIKRQAHVPNGLFFREGQGIIDLFNGYEFTIDENSADDADVALDPELLGKVFENLLGAFNPETQETARKATGSFYTPREIVDYMVEESLKNYLKGRLSDTTKDVDSKLDDLFDRTKAAEGARTMFSRKEEEILLNALYDCKVLDPACGSGAFPMGVLHCMVRLLARLDPDSVSIRERLIARYRADKDFVDPAETASDRRERLAELEKCLDEGQHYPDYARKLYLIENCIYGVDIQPIATQISKLRFFISLLCDQFRTSFNGEENNYGLLSLPNLEAKFVCANTLISLPETSGEFDLTTRGVAEARERLKINRHRIFGARSTGTKEKYKKRDLEIRDEIREAVTNVLAKPDESIIAASTLRISELLKERKAYETPRMVKQLKKVAKPLHQFSLFDTLSPVNGKQELEKEVEVLVDENESKRRSIDSQISIERMKIAAEQEKTNASNVSAAQNYAALVAGWDPFDQNASSEFFDPEWMFNVTDGFDVVIGNPPYISAPDQLKDSKLKAQRERLAKAPRFSCLVQKWDLYIAFMELSIRYLLKKGGAFSMIVPYPLTNQTYGAAIRKMLLTEYALKGVVDLQGVNVFENATVTNCIPFVQKASPLSEVRIIKPDENGRFSRVKVWSVADFMPDTKTCVWKTSEEMSLLFRFRDMHCLGDYCYISIGMVLNADEKTAKGKFVKDDLISSTQDHVHCKKYIEGKDIDSYLIRRIRYLEYGTKRSPGQLRRPTFEELYINNKLLVNGIGRLKATIDADANLYCEQQVRMALLWRDLKGVENKSINQSVKKFSKLSRSDMESLSKDVSLKYLLAILNSTLGQFLFTEIRAGDIHVLPEHLRAIPVALVDDNRQIEISTLVDKILSAKKKDSNADVSALESEIDRLVYKLYGLTDDEIAIVEGRNETKQEPQGETARRPSASPRRRKQVTTPAPPEPTDDEVLE